MLRRLGHQLRSPRQVSLRRRDDPDRPVDDRLYQRHGRRLPNIALEDHVELGQRERAKQERLIGTPEPADRGGVVQVVTIGRGVTALASSRMGTSAGRPAPLGLAPGDRPRVEREAAVPAPSDRDEPELGRCVVLGQVGLHRRSED